MLTVGLLAFMILTYTAQSFFCRLYSNRYPGEASDSSLVFSVTSGTVVALLAFCVSGFAFDFSTKTVLLGVANGIALILYNEVMIRASNKGPYSVQMVFMLSGGILIPAIVNLTRGTEDLSLLQWLAIALIILSIALVSQKKEDAKVSDKRFFLYSAGLFLFNGIYGTLLNLQQDVSGVAEKEEMVFVTFAVTALLSALIGLCRRKRAFFSAFRQTKMSLLCLLISSLATAFAVNLLVLLIELMEDTTVLYTFDNSGVLLISVIGSWLIFKEKLSRTNVIGCVLTCIGLIMISIF